MIKNGLISLYVIFMKTYLRPISQPLELHLERRYCSYEEEKVKEELRPRSVAAPLLLEEKEYEAEDE